MYRSSSDVMMQIILFSRSSISLSCVSYHRRYSNMMPKWTDLEFLIRSHLHVKVLKNKLAPELPRYLDLARKELDYGWALDVPQPEDWTEVDIQHITRMLIARMSAKVFLGFPTCRNKKWLKVSIDYSIDAFTTAFILRMFPTWSHFIVAQLLPSRYRMKQEVRTAMQVVGSLIEKREDNARRRNRGEMVEDDEDTLMHWMLDNGTEEEIKLQEMATRQCVLTLASIHTTATNTANVLFDLCAHPEWFPVLREEISKVNSAIGSLDEQPETGVRRWHSKLEKLDSFLMETLRFNPPIILGPQRLALQSLTLRDGTHIEAGTKISFANYHHMHDPEVVPDPNTFDPMRSYRKRQASPEEHHRHQAWLTDINENLSFGYGNQACPGRFFAVAEVKMVIARFLDNFEFKFPEGKSRPLMKFADENSFIDPSARLLMRKRKVE
ncbi:hypothetical protein RRF57_004587 [Xylaria bambusicola]|uniref:Cytochrome P450 n=1 Tax=Xylaria bambusicola TaxID=326684 RepID=A0AAN7UI00_9PEZI